MDPQSDSNNDDASHTSSPREQQYHSEVTSDPAPAQTPHRGLDHHHQPATSQSPVFSYEMMQQAYASSPASPMVRFSPNSRGNRPASGMPEEPLVTAEQMRSLYSQGFPASGNSPVRPSVWNGTAITQPLNWTRVLTQQSYQGDVGPSSNIHRITRRSRFGVPGRLYPLCVNKNQALTSNQEERHTSMSGGDGDIQEMPDNYPGQDPGSSQFLPSDQDAAIPPDWQSSSSPPRSVAKKGMGSMWRYLKPGPNESSSPLTRRANMANPVSSASSSAMPSVPMQPNSTRRIAKPRTLLKKYAHLAARHTNNAPVKATEDNPDEDGQPPDSPHSTASSTHLDIITDPTARPAASSNYPGGIRAWLAFAVQQADNTQNHRHPKPKYYSTTPVAELQRLLQDEPDVALRAQRFLHDLTGAKIPRRHRFWSTARGREMIWAVEEWMERVRFETVRFDDGEWLSVVDF